MGDWQTCHVWRHLGRWPDPAHGDPRRVNDAVELQIHKGLGIPLGTPDVLEFDRGERDALVTMLFATTVFGWTTSHDLYVVRDHARQVLQTDHHDVVHVEFAAGGDVAPWHAAMSEAGFDLPDDLPDPTFKRPSWMGGGGDR